MLHPTSPLDSGRTRRSRAPLVIAGWVAVLAVIVGVAVAAPPTTPPAPAASPGGASAVAAATALGGDPAAESLNLAADAPPPANVHAITLVHGPMGVGVGLGSVWVVTAKDLRLRRIDPDNNRIVAVIDLPFAAAPLAPGATPLATASGETAFSTVGAGTSLEGSGVVPGVAFGGRFAWVFGVPSTEAIVQVDPGSNHVVRVLRVPLPVSGVVSGPGGTWATTDDGRLIGIDTTNGRIGPIVGVGRDRVAAAAGSDATWISSGDGRTVRIDASGRATASLVGGGGPIAVVDGTVWSAARGFITRIDERTRRVIDRQEIGTSGDAALVRAVPAVAMSDYADEGSKVAPHGTQIVDTGTAEWICRPERGEIWRVDASMR
ncbi:MAG: hypothetical protein ACJ77B_00895 [Chloroflexota bacterium]